jgi:hypothetical protein
MIAPELPGGVGAVDGPAVGIVDELGRLPVGVDVGSDEQNEMKRIVRE